MCDGLNAFSSGIWALLFRPCSLKVMSCYRGVSTLKVSKMCDFYIGGVSCTSWSKNLPSNLSKESPCSQSNMFNTRGGADRAPGPGVGDITQQRRAGR